MTPHVNHRTLAEGRFFPCRLISISYRKPRYFHVVNKYSISSVTEKRLPCPEAAQGPSRAENPVCNSVQSRPWPPSIQKT
jgi:hypothetical protein